VLQGCTEEVTRLDSPLSWFSHDAKNFHLAPRKVMASFLPFRGSVVPPTLGSLVPSAFCDVPITKTPLHSLRRHLSVSHLQAPLSPCVLSRPKATPPSTSLELLCPSAFLSLETLLFTSLSKSVRRMLPYLSGSLTLRVWLPSQ